MHILLVSDFYPPFVGGSELQAQLIGREMVQRGHRFDVATVWHQDLPETEDDQGVTVHRVKALATRVPWFSKDAGRRFHPPFPDPSIVLQLRDLIKRLQPDLVHAQGWIAYSAAAALAGNKAVPLLISARDYGYSCALRTLLYKGETACSGPAPVKCLNCAKASYGWPKAIAAVTGILGGRPLMKRRVDAVHSNSSYTRRVFWRDFLREPEDETPHIIETIIPSFRDSRQEEADEPVEQKYLDQMPDEPFILFVGALNKAKGVDVLLDAYTQLDSPPPLFLIGSLWPETPATFPPGVTMISDVPRSVVMAAWQRSLFGVSPSVWPEPFGNVVHEAMSKGKAMIGTKPGGHADMIDDGVSGLLVPSGDVAALREAMQRLIEDPTLRDQLGAVARESAKKFSSDVMIPRFEAFYEDIVTSLRK